LLPQGRSLPFAPKGKVFKIKWIEWTRSQEALPKRLLSVCEANFMEGTVFLIYGTIQKKIWNSFSQEE
jgi:hypothetical protein